MSVKHLIIEGARQNNLKNITLKIPHNMVIAVTGVSGSGKSSLAFDTIFAEGQWRYIESLSTYARLLLEKMDRPDVDAIYNIRPAIALEQKNPVKGSRSTVGTLTEIYDLLRVLYSKVSTPYCPKCSKEIIKWNPSMIISWLLTRHKGRRAAVIFKTAYDKHSLVQKGYNRILINGMITDIDEHNEDLSGSREVVLDRLVIKDELRLADSIETAWKEGSETLKIMIYDTDRASSANSNNMPFISINFSAQNICDECSFAVPEPSPALFSFNHPVYACPECNGFGNVLVYDENLISPDKMLSLDDGVIEPWEMPAFRWWKQQMLKGAKTCRIDIHKPYQDLSDEERKLIYEGTPHFYGVKDFFKELEGKRYKMHVRFLLSRYRSPVICSACKGAKICLEALAYRIGGLNIAELSDMPVSVLIKWFDNLHLHLSSEKIEIAKEAIKQISLKLRFLMNVGLDYLTLNRQSKTISGGEYQRVNLSNQLASALTSTLYVLDEPTIGLHPRDTDKICGIIKGISAKGNTIIIVEHDRDVISSSDWVIELGPGAGHLGGNVVFAGAIEDFRKSGTLTSQYITGESCSCYIEKNIFLDKKSFLHIIGAKGNNLKNIDLKIPLNSLTIVTGVSGSGKSSLVVETLYRAAARHFKTESDLPLPFKSINGLEKLKSVKLVDQSPIGRTPRSNLLTYMKMFEPIRKLYAAQPDAKKMNLTQGSFSFNVPGGRCETCKGEGYQRMEMYFFEDIFIKCEDCRGKRYKNNVLQVAYKGKNIHDILQMTVEEASAFFVGLPELSSKFTILQETGLGYLRLGQPATTFSGGESQRLKICAELESSLKPFFSKGFLYIFDEPTVGLHYRDVMMFMVVIKRLISKGNTVVIIEHNLDVIAQADWVIDLGPDGGEGGGKIIFEGSPEKLSNASNSYTGRYLKQYLDKFA